jgi:hypothetical protein
MATEWVRPDRKRVSIYVAAASNGHSRDSSCATRPDRAMSRYFRQIAGASINVRIDRTRGSPILETDRARTERDKEALYAPPLARTTGRALLKMKKPLFEQSLTELRAKLEKFQVEIKKNLQI